MRKLRPREALHSRQATEKEIKPRPLQISFLTIGEDPLAEWQL
jgi:hypothetical protein